MCEWVSETVLNTGNSLGNKEVLLFDSLKEVLTVKKALKLSSLVL